MALIMQFWLHAGLSITTLLVILTLQRDYLNKLVWTVDTLDSPIDCSDTDYRTFDGSCNDLTSTQMGSVSTRFNRLGNESIIMSSSDVDDSNDTLLTPNPRLLAQEFLWYKKGEDKRINNLSLLVAPWLQFVSNDLFYHNNQLSPAETIDIEINSKDPLWNKTTEKRSNQQVKDGKDEIKQYYSVYKTKLDDTYGDKEGDSSRPETFQNEVSAWLDASMVYGSDSDTAESLRDPDDLGKLAIDSKGADTNEYILPLFENDTLAVGFNKNMWFGLEMIHKIFVLEHNAFVDNYRRHLGNESEDAADDEHCYQTARLVISALIAKIHITEFAPAVGGDDFQKVFDDSIWYNMELPWFQRVNYPDRGVDTANKEEMSAFTELYKYFQRNPIKGGNGSYAADSDVSYQTVEALVASSRMHSLLPSNIKLQCAKLDKNKYGARTIKKCKDRKYKLEDTLGADQSAAIQSKYMDFDILYSLGVQRPVGLGLNSYPNSFSSIWDDNSESFVDLATIDVVRQRERGVPRYNDYRESVGLARMNDYSNITSSKSVVKSLEKYYESIDDMDLMIGCMVENDGGIRVADGMIFGETMFQAMLYSFTAMVGHDRFYTDSYDSDTYTEYGLSWVELNGFADVIARHYPQLRDYINPNPFINWKLTTTLIDGSDKDCSDNTKEWYEDSTVLGLTISLVVLCVLFCVLLVVYMAQRNKSYDAVQADADY